MAVPWAMCFCPFGACCFDFWYTLLHTALFLFSTILNHRHNQEQFKTEQSKNRRRSREQFKIQNSKFKIQKRLLLPSNSCPFALQKDPFCSPKGLVLQPKRTPFQNALLCAYWAFSPSLTTLLVLPDSNNTLYITSRCAFPA